MFKILRIIHFIAAVLHLGWQLLRQRLYFQRHFSAYLQEILNTSDGSFTAQHRKRMTYYGLTAPVLCCEMYAGIGKLGKEQRQLITNLAMLSPLFDDFFDESHLDSNILRELMQQPFSHKGKNTFEQTVIGLLQQIEPKVRDKSFFFEVAEAIFQAQSDSATSENIQDACFRKGGYSTLLFPAALQKELHTNYKKVCFEYGAMMQWMDDIFDLYEDSKAGFGTLATDIADFRATKVAYNERLAYLKNDILALPTSKNARWMFWYKAFVFLSLGFVCIEQFINLQYNIGFTALSAEKNDRKLLICDMEKFGNIKVWLYNLWTLL